ncbi:MAG: TlpA family protein disulfide reductase [Chloroflexi bacterium]|nr:MAG: TlpA family protein disulfide reductase [Chloroflexota bacterium]
MTQIFRHSVLLLLLALLLWGCVAAPPPAKLPTPIPSGQQPTPHLLAVTPPPAGTAMTGIRQGQLAPDFSLPTLDGGTLALSSLRGRPVLLNFWASWCVPCRQEMPALVRAYRQFNPQGLEIVAFNVTYQDSLADVRAFVDEFSMPFPVVLDQAGHVTEDSYQLRGLPMSIFINPAGVVTRIQLGAMDDAQVTEFVAELLVAGQ